jgi:hypothetical protein
LGIGDWGLGIGDWGPIPNPQSPIPKSPIPNIYFLFYLTNFNKKINKTKLIYIKK